MTTIDGTQWTEYLQTSQRMKPPVKLDHILAERIQAFIRAKKIRIALQDDQTTPDRN